MPIQLWIRTNSAGVGSSPHSVPLGEDEQVCPRKKTHMDLVVVATCEGGFSPAQRRGETIHVSRRRLRCEKRRPRRGASDLCESGPGDGSVLGHQGSTWLEDPGSG